jgi:hypothetical protein
MVFPGNTSGQPSVTYPADVCKSESINAESEVTEHPVENGTAISDHVIVKPIEYNCECVVSDTPIGRVALDPTRADLEGASTPSVEFYTRMMAMRGTRQTCSIVTLKFGTLSNMELTSFEPKADQSTGNAIEFTAKFRQINIATTARVTVQVSVPNAGPESDQGNLQGGPLTGKYVTWRHGSPPGGLDILYTEILSIGDKQQNPPNLGGGTSVFNQTLANDQQTLPTMLYHSTSADKSVAGQPLSPDEYTQFQADWNRDYQVTVQAVLRSGNNPIFGGATAPSSLAAAEQLANKQGKATQGPAPTQGPVQPSMFGY